MLPISAFDKNSAFKANKINQNFNLIGKIKLKVLIISCFLILAVLTTQMVFASSLAVDGEKLSQIEQELERLDVENTQLRARIAQESSFKTLSQKATQLGFTKPKKISTLQTF